MCIDFLGRNNQSLRNKSGKTQPIRTKFGRLHVDRSRGDNVQGAIGAFLTKWGWDKFRGARVFLCGITKRCSVSRR